MYASRWEFCLIEPLNGFDEEIKEIGPSFNKRLLALKDVDGVNELPRRFGHRARPHGQSLRAAPLPDPLGPDAARARHLGAGAQCSSWPCISYLFSLYLDGCPQRRINDFYCGLFHDLAELLTRDIITPVKRSVAQLPEIIHQYEDEELHSKILDPLEQEGYGHIRERLDYYLGLTTKSEFHDNLPHRSGHSEGGRFRRSPGPLQRRPLRSQGRPAHQGLRQSGRFHRGLQLHPQRPSDLPISTRPWPACAATSGAIRLGSFSLAPLLADFD